MYFSVVSPVYKAENIIEELVLRIKAALSYITDEYEIILVEDCGPDNSWSKIEAECKKDTRVKGIKLSRNFGQHPAIFAGLEHTKGQWVVVMDCDLQDQPEEIVKMYNKALEGFDAVIGMRAGRKDSFSKKFFSRLFSIIFNYLADLQMNYQVANYGVYNRKLINSILKIGDYSKSFPLFVYWSGFKTISIPIAHAKRAEGKSSYSFGKLISLAFNGILAYSEKPLKLFIQFGLLVSIISFIGGMIYLSKYLNGTIEVKGFTSLIISIWFFSGVIITMMGVLGLYISKVFNQSKNRPVYLIDHIIN